MKQAVCGRCVLCLAALYSFAAISAELLQLWATRDTTQMGTSAAAGQRQVEKL